MAGFRIAQANFAPTPKVKPTKSKGYLVSSLQKRGCIDGFPSST